MNLNYGYQIYQAQRTMTRQEIVAGDVRRGQEAAAVVRACRHLARRAHDSGTMVLNAIAGPAARTASTQTEES
jgi:hypothetical protein